MLKLGDVELKYGELLQATIDFLIIAFSVFVAIKLIGALRRKSEEAPAAPAPKPDDVVLLEQIRDILQKQEYLFINIKGDTIGKPLRVDSVYDMFERMEKKTGIKITPHMLRRYYANTRWEADWPLEMISQALGHKHLDTTIRYLNVLDDKLKTASQEFYRRYSKLYGVEQFLESRR